MSAATATPAKKEEKTGLLATVANNARQYGIVGALLVIVVAFEILTGGVLLKPNSFVSLIQQNAYAVSYTHLVVYKRQHGNTEGFVLALGLCSTRR